MISAGFEPVGAVIVLEGEVAAEGHAALLVPHFDGTRHAEMETLRADVVINIYSLKGQQAM